MEYSAWDRGRISGRIAQDALRVGNGSPEPPRRPGNFVRAVQRRR